MKPLQIGGISIKNPLVLAPMAGVTNLPFRLLIKHMGAGLLCSEMVSAQGLVRRAKQTWNFLQSSPGDTPLSLQIFGSDPSVMAEAGVIVAESGADLVDVNFGCSVRKVLKNGAGSALMKEPQKAREILTAMRKAIQKPLTIKIRSGWDPSGEQALELARIAQDCGVDSIAVHPRTAQQLFRGTANWDHIRQVKERVSIPVMGNGDIVEPGQVLEMREQTGCDFFMIGRAARQNPWIFTQAKALLEGREPSEPTLSDRKAFMLMYLDDSTDHLGEWCALPMMRSRLGWFTKGLYNSTKFRESIKLIQTREQAREKIEEYFFFLEEREKQG